MLRGSEDSGRCTLVTGASGLLGLNLALTSRGTDRVVLGVHRRVVTVRGCESVRLELGDRAAVRELLRQVRPTRVIHAAGLADVEGCEAEPARAFADNVLAAEHVATACAAEGVQLVHISTDHLFHGNRSMVDEHERVAPVNEYGRTKAEAESRVLAACPNALVVRTNFFGWGPVWRRSFSDFVIDSCRAGRPFNAWTDVYHTPISIPALATAINELLSCRARGVFHVVGDERISKYDLAMLIVHHLRLEGSLVRPALAAEVKGRVARPMDMSLSNRRLCETLGRGIGGAHDMVRDLGARAPAEIEALQ